MENISFEGLTNEQKIVLALKESLKRYKATTNEYEKEFYGQMIGRLAHDLKLLGVYDKYFYNI